PCEVKAVPGEDVLVALRRTEPVDGLRFGLEEHRRAAVGPSLDDGVRRLQMADLCNDIALEPVVFNRFTWKSHQDVIKVVNVVVGAPFDQLQIPHACGVLSHYSQDIGRQALDAGLNGDQPAPSHLPKLPPGDIWANLVMEPNISVGLGKLPKQLVSVIRSQDVVDRIEVKNPEVSRDTLQLRDHVLRILCPELHSPSVQPTKGALIPHSLPTAACGFQRQQHLPGIRVHVVATFFSGVEVFVEIRYGCPVHFGEIWRSSGICNAAIIPPHDAALAVHRLAVVEPAHHLGKRYLGVSAMQVVDLGAMAHHLVSDVVFEAGPSHNYRYFRVDLLQGPSKGQARKQLLKNDRKANQTKTAPVDRLQAEIYKGFGGVIPDAANVIDGAVRAPADRAEDPLIGLKVVRPVRIDLVPEGGAGPDPFADHARPHIGDGLVDLPAD